MGRDLVRCARKAWYQHYRTTHRDNGDVIRSHRPWLLITVLLISGVAGLWAALALTLDKFAVLVDPTANLDCNFSIIVQCGANLQSWQGSVFFDIPNPIWGLMGWVAPIIVAGALIAGARFASWFWLLLNLGMAGALAFCIWLMAQSIFVIGTLCPWCMLTWAATILAFWTVTFYNLKSGHFGAWARRAGSILYTWAPLVSIASYLVIAVIAQLRLDVLRYLV